MNGYNRFPIRKSPRIRNFDYTACYYYFVTICTKGKICLFGDGQKLSPMGNIARDCLLKLPSHFPEAAVDKWVVMPNHIHTIITLSGNGHALPAIVGQYKSAVSKAIHKIAPDRDVWQSSFHDHIIRNQADYQRIWLYIEGNPARWNEDCFYVSEHAK